MPGTAPSRRAWLALWISGALSVATALTLASLLAGVAAVVEIPGLRRRLITGPLLGAFRRVLPDVSPTERQALEAGTVGWEGEFFGGRPDWARLFATPSPRLSAQETAFLEGPVEALCARLDDWDITARRRDLPPEIWAFLREQRFFGMIIPCEFGGLGFSAYAHSQVVMKVASRSVAAAVTIMVPNSLGPAKLLLHYGTAE